MATRKSATEDTLGELHSVVAKVMINALDNVEKAQVKFDEALDEMDPVEAAALVRPDIAPAFLSAAIKFLADNKITCQPIEGTGTNALADKLAARRRKTVGNVVPMIAEED